MMGHLSQHWTFWERVKWLWSGRAPNRDVLTAEMRRLQIEHAEKTLELIDLAALQEGRIKKMEFLEHEVNR